MNNKKEIEWIEKMMPFDGENMKQTLVGITFKKPNRVITIRIYE